MERTVGVLSKYEGDSLHGFNELTKSLKNQSGCCGKKESAWEDQYMGERMMVCTKVVIMVEIE